MLMAKPSDTPGFKALLQEWNQKLLDSGLEDIEESRKGKLQLKRTGTVTRFEQSTAVVRDAKAKYFEIIGEKILETQFDDEREKQILCMYYEGYTQAEIRKQLSPPLHRYTIYKKLYKWLRRWGLK